MKTKITRYVVTKDIVIPYKTLEKAAEEANDYDWMRAGTGHTICVHGANGYAIIEDGDTIGCSCEAWTYAHGNDGCKHVAAFLKRSKPPQKPITDEIARDLMAAGWTGGKGNLHAPEITSDPDGEDNEGNDPVPERAPKPTVAKNAPVEPEPEEEPKMWITGRCPWCELEFKALNAHELKCIIEEHEEECPERAEYGLPPRETKMEEEAPTETKKYTHPDGTVFETAEALLDYAETLKAGQTAGEKTVDPATFIAPMIRNLGAPQLTEAGGIRIGKKRSSGKGAETFDHFIFTLPEKDPMTGDFLINKEMTERYGENCRELPVRLLSDDITECFTTFYAEYGAGGIKIRGDGVNWAVTNPDGSKTYIEDPNGEKGFLKNPNVKPHGILTVLVDGQNSIGTVYRFRTTGWNSIKGMLASLSLCAEIAKRAGGRIAFVPMTLVYRTKEVTPKGERYKKTIPVITVEFRGTIEDLQERSKDATNYLSAAPDDMMQITGSSSYDPDAETPEEMEDVRAEFYPEAI